MLNIHPIEKELKELSNLVEMISKYPDSEHQNKIFIRQRNGRDVFSEEYRDAEGVRRERYLSKENLSAVTNYYQTKYYKKLLPLLKNEIKLLRYFLKGYKPEAKEHLIKAFPSKQTKYIDPVFVSKEELCATWESASYETNTIAQEYPNQYISKKGDHVRSRIELLIANFLYDNNIPYRYECKLEMNGKTIFPDFTIMHPETLEIYYIEIFGMMDNETYAASALRKIKNYTDNGLYTHFLPFFDSKDAPLSVNSMEEALREIFLS